MGSGTAAETSAAGQDVGMVTGMAAGRATGSSAGTVVVVAAHPAGTSSAAHSGRWVRRGRGSGSPGTRNGPEIQFLRTSK